MPSLKTTPVICSLLAQLNTHTPQNKNLRPRHALRKALHMAGLRMPCNGAKIGLLGGSFHPPHQGHILLAQEALRTLDLDAVWFLPAPSNPLKEKHAKNTKEKNKASATQRAQALTKCIQQYAPARQGLAVVPLQDQCELSLTSDTLDLLHQAAPKIHFVWIGGADLLAELHQWHKWQSLIHATPLAFFDRRSHTAPALRGMVSARYKHRRLKTPAKLASAKPPAWTLVRQKTSPLAARNLPTQNP